VKSAHAKRIIRYANGSPRSLGKTQNVSKPWGLFLKRFMEPMRSGERLADYLKRPKAAQDRLKMAAGWFIGAPMDGNRRNRKSILPRDLITFDCDAMTPELLAELRSGEHPFCRLQWAMHTTRKHTPENPRVRFLIPAAREIDPDTYDAVARILAHQIDPTMDTVDDVSFRAAQLMYRPSCSSDSEYIFEHNPGILVDPEPLLEAWTARNGDWRDWRNLPYSLKQGQKRAAEKKAENPLEKQGIIGAFCRAYSVEEAIEAFLSEHYALGDSMGGKPRYTYLGGSTSNGVVVEDDGLFIYSHHSTDPCSDRLCNAFDMVRLHLFAAKDADAEPDTSPGKLPSFKAMVEWAGQLGPVKNELFNNTLSAIAEFEDISDQDDEVTDGNKAGSEDPNTESDWRGRLEFLENGRGLRKSLQNYHLIIQNDPRIKGRIVWDEMTNRTALRHEARDDGKGMVRIPQLEPGQLGRSLTEMDGRLLRAMLEYAPSVGGYGLGKVAVADVEQAIAVVAHESPVNAARDFFDACADEWDGHERLFTMLHHHLGEEQNAYTAAAGTLMMVGTVARTYEPGHKFDFMPVISGAQGVHKSSYLRTIVGDQWGSDLTHGFSDTNRMVEQMEGKLIVEVPELSAMRKDNLERMKEMITVQSDKTRLAYGRMAQEYPRRSILVGTTNEHTYLTDPTGNRRFWPLNVPAGSKINLKRADIDRRQLWGEAVHTYRDLRRRYPGVTNLPLYLDPEAEAIWAVRVESVKVDDITSDTAARIAEWLAKPIPLSSLFRPETFHDDGEPLVIRTKVSVAEIVEQVLRLDL
jgi:putative DNA primase/helicase